MGVIEAYTDSCRPSDELIFGSTNEPIKLWGKHYARVIAWETAADGQDDLPVFEFYDIENSPTRNRAEMSRLQYLKKPFVDNPNMLYGATWATQAVGDSLSLREAEFVIFARDKWDGDFDAVGFNQPALPDKIKSIVHEVYYRRVPEAASFWKHFLLCAVYGLSTTR